MRLGLLWFVLGLVALILNVFVAAVLFAVVAGFAAHQAALTWQREREPVQVVTAVVAAAGFPLAAAFSHVTAGFWVLLFTVGSLAAALVRTDKDELPMREVAYTLQSSLFVGLAAASPILAFHEDKLAALVLFVFVAAYDCGDFLVGAGSRSSIEGPIAGALAVAACSFSLQVMSPEPFVGAVAWIYGIAVMIFAPVGQVAASAMLARWTDRVPALRRLDTLIVVGPIFLLMLRLS